MLIGITTVKTVCDCLTQEWILRLYVGQHQGATAEFVLQSSCLYLCHIFNDFNCFSLANSAVRLNNLPCFKRAAVATYATW